MTSSQKLTQWHSDWNQSIGQLPFHKHPKHFWQHYSVLIHRCLGQTPGAGRSQILHWDSSPEDQPLASRTKLNRLPSTLSWLGSLVLFLKTSKEKNIYWSKAGLKSHNIWQTRCLQTKYSYLYSIIFYYHLLYHSTECLWENYKYTFFINQNKDYDPFKKQKSHIRKMKTSWNKENQDFDLFLP